MPRTLLDKVWEAHTVRTLPSGQTQLLIGLHLIHEVTTPQAFQMLKDSNLKVRMPERTFGTLDHIIPTTDQTRPYADPMAEDMAVHMYRNMKDFGLPLFDMSTGKQGIVHVIGPELGLSQPGMTIACGDSHTSTHGAVGAIAFGIGTTQVRDVLATQCLAMAKPKLRQVRVEGTLTKGVYAKDVILAIINQLGVKGGVGYAYEYAGPVIERMTMEERLTVCNMSIEGGARFGYVNPDTTTIEYLRGRPHAPAGATFDRAAAWWKAIATEPGAAFDDVARLDGAAIEPVVTWGINPEMSVGVTRTIPSPESQPEPERPPSARRWRTWAFRRASRSRVRGSTSPSSAPAPTAASPTFAWRPRSRRRARSPSTCERSSCRARSRWRRPPRPRGCTRSSRPPDFSGGRPAARCASA